MSTGEGKFAIKKEKTATIKLEYQNYIEKTPYQPEALFKHAASNDDATMDKWRDTWVNQFKKNKEIFGELSEMGIGKLHGRLKYKPALIAGSGPSLKNNVEELKNRPRGIALISCLHNFHFFEDNGVEVDYYVTMDAGPVTIEEVSEGGKLSPDEYWEKTKGKTLLAYVGSHPELLKKWKGEILFFNAPMTRADMEQDMEAVEKFHTYVSPGGNVLGACLYIAKAIMGANPIAFIGADFSFGYDKRFHSWDSKYDEEVGDVQWTTDVFGNRVFTWPSYHGFKCFFDYVAMTVPGLYINCSEGGTLGAYQQGNIMQIKQMDLVNFFQMYELCELVVEQCKNPKIEQTKVLLF